MKPGWRQKTFLPYPKAQVFVHTLKLKSEGEWRTYVQYRPVTIPSNPHTIYAGKGWTTWGDWLGTGRVCTRDRKYRSFPQARRFIRRLKLKNLTQWQAFTKSEERPDDIPGRPDRFYAGKGWKGYGDWLGTGRKPCFPAPVK